MAAKKGASKAASKSASKSASKNADTNKAEQQDQQDQQDQEAVRVLEPQGTGGRGTGNPDPKARGEQMRAQARGQRVRPQIQMRGAVAVGNRTYLPGEERDLERALGGNEQARARLESLGAIVPVADVLDEGGAINWQRDQDGAVVGNEDADLARAMGVYAGHTTPDRVYRATGGDLEAALPGGGGGQQGAEQGGEQGGEQALADAGGGTASGGSGGEDEDNQEG